MIVKCMYWMIMCEYCEMYNKYASKAFVWHDQGKVYVWQDYE